MPDQGPIDAQFHRAVDLVQGLPKSGPVQTSYEEKLQLYSLYKQATEGDNAAPRPGMLDMLGRAKWDSWAKQRGVTKGEAKQSYVSALLKILQRFEDRDPGAKQWARELTTMGPLPERPTSPASSDSSFHSSRASPPPDHHRLLQEDEHDFDGFSPPDPSLPAPDVAPNIIPPSALNPTHRSLVNAVYPYSDGGQAGASYAGPSGSRAQSLFGGSASERDPLAALRSRRGTAPALDYVPEQEQAAAAPQRPSSHMSGGPGHQPYPGQHSYGQVPTRTPSVPPLTSAYQPLSRDFGTPDIPTSLYQGSPMYQRPTSASTFSHAPPVNLPATLQQIHTSLQALHERLSTLERTQAALLRRDERRRGWFWGGEEDDIDTAELDAQRERWQMPSTTIRLRRKGMSARIAWALITAVRRAIIGVGASVLVAAIALMLMRGGWRRNMRLAWKQTRLRLLRLLAD